MSKPIYRYFEERRWREKGRLDLLVYTLVMVDPDVPDPENLIYKQFLHWVVPKIPLSALQSGKNVPLPENHPVPWIPPHPTNGTKYHRYVIFLFQNPDSNRPLEIPEY